MTVTSLVANVGYVSKESHGASDDAGRGTVRIVDYPGHPSLASQLPSLLRPSHASRVLFAMDATSSVAEGVKLLYHSILTHSQVRDAWKGYKNGLVVLVVCTKQDGRGAKNHKRMKIQVRNELDRLRKVDLAMMKDGGNGENGATGGHHAITLNVKGKTIDLDNLGPDVSVSLHFVEAGFGLGNGKENDDSGSMGLRAVREFVLTGALPEGK